MSGKTYIAAREQVQEVARPWLQESLENANQARSEMPELLRGGSDAGQVARNARVQANDALRKLVHGRDQRKPNSGHDQRILDQVLTLLISN